MSLFYLFKRLDRRGPRITAVGDALDQFTLEASRGNIVRDAKDTRNVDVAIVTVTAFIVVAVATVAAVVAGDVVAAFGLSRNCGRT